MCITGGRGAHQTTGTAKIAVQMPPYQRQDIAEGSKMLTATADCGLNLAFCVGQKCASLCESSARQADRATVSRMTHFTKWKYNVSRPLWKHNVAVRPFYASS